jgi:hypothetical protein
MTLVHLNGERVETSEFGPAGESSALGDAISYLEIAWDIVRRDAADGSLDAADLLNLEERLAIAESVLAEHLKATAPTTHRDPLESLSSAEIQEAYYRLPFAVIDVQSLPWDDLIARLRSVAHSGNRPACVAYEHAVRDQLRQISDPQSSIHRGVLETLEAVRERYRSSIPHRDDIRHEQARYAMEQIAAVRQDIEAVRADQARVADLQTSASSTS